MTDDDRISAMFHDAVSTLDVPTARLVTGGISRGRRRKRVIRGLESLSVLGIVCGVAALVITLLPGGSRPATVAGGEGSATAVFSSPQPSRSPSSQPSPATVPVTPQALLQAAIDTLPRPGTTTDYFGNDSSGWASTQFVYDDGHGASQIYVSIGYEPYEDEDTTPCKDGSPHCTVLGDGAHVKSWTYKEYGPGDPRTPNATNWKVSLVRPDGLQVGITEFNAAQEKDSPLTRDVPPFSIAELTTWADGGQWTKDITQQRADETAGLFSTDNPDASPSETSTFSDKRQERRNCRVAVQVKKQPPSYCH